MRNLADLVGQPVHWDDMFLHGLSAWTSDVGSFQV